VSAIDRQVHVQHQASQFVIHAASECPSGFAGQIVERQQSDQRSAFIDHRKSTGAVLRISPAAEPKSSSPVQDTTLRAIAVSTRNCSSGLPWV